MRRVCKICAKQSFVGGKPRMRVRIKIAHRIITLTGYRKTIGGKIIVEMVVEPGGGKEQLLCTNCNVTVGHSVAN